LERLPMSKKQSLEKLNRILDREFDAIAQVFYRNSFAMICHLVTHGELRAAEKQLKYFFDVLGRHDRKTYFAGISASIEDFAVEYAREIGANLEINKLFRDYE